MPKRLLDDSLLTSTSLARCSPRAQDAWPRFLLLADDFGCFEVIPRALAARGWVYRQDVSEGDMVAWLEEYLAAGMACLWTVNERRYCYLTGWHGEHGQKHRAEYDREHNPKGSKRRTPAPPADLVAAVKAGCRRDRDGLPPGVDRVESTADREPAGNEPGTGRDAEIGNPEQFRSRAGNDREPGGKTHSPGHFPGSAVPVAVPVPVAGGTTAAAAGIPTKAQHLAARAPMAQALVDALAASGWSLTHAAVDKRATLEAALATTGTAAACVLVHSDLEARASKGQETPGSLGFYVGDLVALSKRQAARTEPPASVPVVDLAWLDQLPESRRAEARAAWAVCQADVERSFQPSAHPRALASAAEMLRQEYAS